MVGLTPADHSPWKVNGRCDKNGFRTDGYSQGRQNEASLIRYTGDDFELRSLEPAFRGGAELDEKLKESGGHGDVLV